MTEAQTLAAVVERTREYARFYLKYLKDVDPQREFVLDGVRLNTVYWLVAHMAVSQNWLLLRSTGGPFEKFTWAKHFNIGGTPPDPSVCPPYAEVWEMFKHIHEKSVPHIASLTDDQLGQPHQAMLQLGGQGQVRDVIMHHIRHENLHTGHLSWSCRLHGIKTM